MTEDTIEVVVRIEATWDHETSMGFGELGLLYIPNKYSWDCDMAIRNAAIKGWGWLPMLSSYLVPRAVATELFHKFKPLCEKGVG